MPTAPRRGRLARRAIALTVAALAAGALTSTGTSAQADGSDGYSLTWPVSPIVSGHGDVKGTYNFFSAGALRDPGEAGRTLRTATHGATWSNGRAAGWSAHRGNVSILAPRTKGQTLMAYGDRGTSPGTDSRLPAGRSSGLVVKMDHGSGGTRSDGSADIRWKGSFTIIVSSGLATLTVSNPRLVVRDGVGTLTGTVSGQATVLPGYRHRVAVPPRHVTLAQLVVTEAGGYSDIATVYRRTSYVNPPGTKAQREKHGDSDDTWGSFPQSFVDLGQELGIGEMFYSSGGSEDLKVGSQLDVIHTQRIAPTVSVRPARYGTRRSAVVTLADASGAVTLTGPRGFRSVSRISFDAKAGFELPTTWEPGSYPLVATFATTGWSTAVVRGTFVVRRAVPYVLPEHVKAPTTTRAGSARVRLGSDGPGPKKDPTGTVRLYLQQGRTRVYGASAPVTSRAPIPRATHAGTWTLQARYSGDSRYAPTTSDYPKTIVVK